MAERKPLFMDQTEGYHEEMDPNDTATFGGLTLNGNIDMNTNKITDLGAGTTAGDALSYGQTGAQLGQDTQITGTTGHPTLLNGDTTLQGPVTQGGTTFTADLDMANYFITNLGGPPVNPGDAANKAYVDAMAQGLSPHTPVVAMSDSNINLAGTMPTSIDSVTLAPLDRVLLTGQTNQVENGIYVVANPVTAAWSRAADLTTGDHAQGVYVFIEGGTNYGNTGWTCTAVAPNDVVDTNNLPWVLFFAMQAITAGDGIKILTGVVSVNLATNPGLEFDASLPGKLQAKPDGTRGMAKDSSGLYVKVDGTTVQFNGSGQLTAPSATSAGSVEILTVEAAGGVAKGDPVYWGANDKVTKGQANADVKSRVIGVAMTTVLSGANTDVVAHGPAVGVLVGAAVNTPYYLQALGGIGTALPGAANRVIQVGTAKNATDLWVNLRDFGKKAA